MKKRNCYFIVIVVLFILLVFILMPKDRNGAVQKINNLFYQIFAEAENDYKEISVTNSESMEDWLYEKYGNYFTSNGWDMAIKNRSISLGINQYRQTDSEPQEIKVQVTKRKDMENWYSCQIELVYQNEKTVNYYLTLQCVKQDNDWLIEYITR